MKRNIIQIDEKLCNGCGNCVTGCSEGALKIIDGKAKVVSETFCDGFGDCIGHCPTGALKIVEREAEEFDIAAVEKHLKNNFGDEAVEKMREAQKVHESKSPSPQGGPAGRGRERVHHGGGCPGSRMMTFGREAKPAAAEAHSDGGAETVSELTNWPVQLKLISPGNPVFSGADILVAADCVAFSYGGFHRKLLKGKTLVIACPKLDEDLDEYVEKLSTIFKNHDVKSVTCAIMEVPCCGGLLRIVQEAVRLSGKPVLLKVMVVGVRGDIQEVNP